MCLCVRVCVRACVRARVCVCVCVCVCVGSSPHHQCVYYTLQTYPMAVVGTAGRHVVIYQLENTPSEFKVGELLIASYIKLVIPHPPP